MPMSFGGWNVLGIGAAVAIVAGIVLLVVYAVGRGLVHRDLDGTLPAEEGPAVDTTPLQRRPARRTIGLLGAVVLVIGLGLGVLSAITGWGASGTSGSGPGGANQDCAQSWSGCPQATARP